MTIRILTTDYKPTDASTTAIARCGAAVCADN